MKKIVVLSFLFHAVFNLAAQHASGYLGKRFSVNVGVAINPLLMQDATTRKQYDKLSQGAMIDGEGLPHSARGLFVAGEYAMAEYTGICLELASRPNAIKIQTANYFSYQNIVYNLSCKNINVYARWYSKSMGPAPLGNYFSFGINYAICRLDSFHAAFRHNDPWTDFDATAIDLYNSQGKFNFFDVSFATGRSFVIKNWCILKMEFAMPYFLRFFPSLFYTIEDDTRSVTHDEVGTPGFLSKLLVNKIAINNLFNYKIGIGIPF